MSGALGPIVSQLLNGANRPAPVILGSMTLEGHEAPSEIGIGGRQAHTLHRLPGGGRIIDAMGPDENTVAWKGLFIGPSAASRVRDLDSMRVQGIPVGLSFGDYQFTVLIVGFDYSYRDRGAIISYKVRTEIVPNQPFALTSPSDTLSSVIRDVTFAQQLLTNTTATAAAYQGLLIAPDPISSDAVSALSAQSVSLIASLGAQSGNPTQPSGTAMAALADAIVASRQIVGSLSVGHFVGNASTLTLESGADLAGVVVDAGALAGVVRAGAYLSRGSLQIAAGTASVSPTYS